MSTSKPSNSTSLDYKAMFDNIPSKKRTNLFGEEKVEDATLADIQAYVKSLAFNFDGKVSANRINFVLNGIKGSNVTAGQINTVGQTVIEEATLASKSVDKVVTEFADLKPHLEKPKSLVLDAVKLIDSASPKKSFFSFLRPEMTIDLTSLRTQVKHKLEEANEAMNKCLEYRLDPFISGLGDAKYYLGRISQDLDQCCAALEYVQARTSDDIIKDLAQRRKEMFTKSLVLMNMNKGQLDSMQLICEKNKAFATEIEMTILPVIENVIRQAVINDVGGTSLNEISNKLKELIS